MDNAAKRWWLRAAAAALAATLLYPAVSAVKGGASGLLPPVDREAVSAPRTENDLESPHGAEPQCAACHRAHTAVGEELLVAEGASLAVCTSCHTRGGEEPKSTHSNVDYPYATQAPFLVTCAACHDPHGDPDGPGNRAMIRSQIGGYDVRLLHERGEDSYDDGLDDGVVDSLCVVCHTTTSHNNVYSAELQGGGHGPVGTDCTACHRHGDDPASRSGFMAEGWPTPTPTPTSPPTETPEPTPAPTDTPEPAPTEPPTATPLPTDTPLPTPAPLPTEPPPPDGAPSAEPGV